MSQTIHMTVSAHTPGPWHWNDQGGWVYADVPDGITVNGACDPYYGGFLIGESISRANGPIITAAPDYFAAVEQMLAYEARGGDGWWKGWEMLKAAHAKAGGSL